MPPRYSRILIAAPATGVGKTIVSVALMIALRKRGMTVQGFKVGPDYIDPSYHALVTDQPSRNLDCWMLPPETVRDIFLRGAKDAEISVVEGVMGLFDGFSPVADTGSTAELAKLLSIPVLLVVDAKSQSRSAAALIQGFQKFDPQIRIAGVILNRVSSPAHGEVLEQAIKKYTTLPVVGQITMDEGIEVPERHLGLVPAWEDPDVESFLKVLDQHATEWFDLDRIVHIAQTAQSLSGQERSLPTGPGGQPVRIAYPRDKAFQFYYPENLDLLKSLGGELVSFSPLADGNLPDGTAALYFGGGFPEVFAERLAQNAGLRNVIREAVAKGMPTYAECGGLMYLAGGLKTRDGVRHEMCGAIPGDVEMTEKLQNFGYSIVVAARDSLLAKAGETARGHEFHYSRWEPPQGTAAWQVTKRKGVPPRLEGYAQGNVLASYVHLHFMGKPDWARRFVEAAAEFRKSQSRFAGTVKK